MEYTDLQIVVLAAGKASRMGKPKQLLPVKNHSLIEEVLQTANKINCLGITCVLGANYERIKPVLDTYSVNTVINPEWESGLSSSISIGISTAVQHKPQTKRILLLLADQPHISIKDLQQMIRQSSSGDEQIIASDYGGFYGVPVLFSEKHFLKFKNLKGDSGAKEFLNDPNQLVIPCTSQPHLQDIDTPADYEEYLKSIE